MFIKKIKKSTVVPNLAPPIQIPATQLDPTAFIWLTVNIMFCNVIKNYTIFIVLPLLNDKN